MGQLLKKTLIIKDIDNGQHVFGIAKVHKNSIFKIYFELKNINITDDLTAAIVSTNLPIQFVQFRTKEFDIDLDKSTELENLVVIILNKSNDPLAASECDPFSLSGYLDTVKNLKRQFKRTFSFNNEWQNSKEPIEVVPKKQELNESVKTLKDILEQPKIVLNNNAGFEQTKKEDFKSGNTSNRRFSQSQTAYNPFKNRTNAQSGFRTGKEIIKDDMNIYRQNEPAGYSGNSYVDDDILLREDSTLGDNLKIAEENYFEYDRALNNRKPVKHFYESIKGELDELFKRHEREVVLERMIAQSRFCKIMFEEGRYYIVGLIFEDNVPQFICYGVPTYNPHTPPKELEGFCSYIPTNPDNLNELGYWLMYQDTETGETIYPNS